MANNNYDIMTKTGKNNKIILSSDEIFLNTKCLFVEYYDVIKAPWYLFVNYLRTSDVASQLFDFSELVNYDMNELFEWYITRKHKNPLKDIPITDFAHNTIFHNNEVEKNTWLDSFLESEMQEIPELIEGYSELNFQNILDTLINTGRFAKDIQVYTETYNEKILNDLKSIYNDNVRYVYGDLDIVIKDIPNDSTFVFSDIMKINKLKSNGKLNMSSVIIADRFAYNYENENTPKINLEELMKSDIFKIDFFDNIYTYE